MDRRPVLLAAVLLSCGCASLRDLAASANAPLPPDPPRVTAAQAYQDGLLALTRGDADAARRSWDRCLALSAAESPERLDCSVALERLDLPGGLEHRE